MNSLSGITEVDMSGKTEAVKGIYKILLTRMKIRSFLKNGYNYSLNNNFKEARKEYSKVLEYEQNIIFKRLIITAKLNLYNTYHYDMINRQESLEYARINEENLLKELPNYRDRKHLIFSWYKYQYALLCCNLGNTYNELALMRDAKNNYNSSKKYSLQAVIKFALLMLLLNSSNMEMLHTWKTLALVK
jgi:hypothetical protein